MDPRTTSGSTCLRKSQMANSISVLRPGQDVGAKPFRYITPRIATHLLGFGVAFWILPKKILGIRDISEFMRCLSDMDPEQRQAARIKELLLSPMPPREVNGTWFQMPQSDQWKIQHRTVKFMPRMVRNCVRGIEGTDPTLSTGAVTATPITTISCAQQASA